MDQLSSLQRIVDFAIKTLKTIVIPIVVPYLVIKIYANQSIKRLINSKPLKGKVVVVTGASSGLGKDLCRVLYKSGARLILSSRNVELLEEVKQMLIGTNGSHEECFEPHILKLDLSDSDHLQEYAKQALSFYGKIDILVNNAGISYRGRVVETKLEVDRYIMNVNYFGQIALIKALLPQMIERRSGQIVVISSIQGLLAIPYRSAYTASKHALQAFCDSLRAELWSTNVSICVVSPGYIKTNLSINAVTGSGQPYGMMDETTAKGMSPQEAAQQILISIIKNDKQLVLAPLVHKMAIIIRFLFPNIYIYLMSKRAKNESNQ